MECICLDSPSSLNAPAQRLNALQGWKLRLQQPHLWSILGTFGYQKDDLTELEQQHAAARQLWSEIQVGWVPGDRLWTPLLAALEAWQKLFSVGRIAFQSTPHVVEELGFHADMASSLEAWIEQTHEFTQRILGHPFYLETMEECGQDKASLESLQNTLIEVEAASAMATARQKEWAALLLQLYALFNRLELWHQRAEGFLFLSGLQTPEVTHQTTSGLAPL